MKLFKRKMVSKSHRRLRPKKNEEIRVQRKMSDSKKPVYYLAKKKA